MKNKQRKEKCIRCNLDRGHIKLYKMAGKCSAGWSEKGIKWFKRHLFKIR